MGFIFTLVLVLENAVRDAIKLILREGFVDLDKKFFSKQDIRKIDDQIWKKFMHNMYGERSWKDGKFISRLIGVFPFQGIVYSDSIMIPLLIILTLADYFRVNFVGSLDVSGYLLGFIQTYIIIVCIAKIIWMLLYISKIEKSRPITKTLKKM